MSTDDYQVNSIKESWPYDIKAKDYKDNGKTIYYIDNSNGKQVAKFNNLVKALYFMDGTDFVLRAYHLSNESIDSEYSTRREEYRQQNRVHCHRDLAVAKARRRTYKLHSRD